MTEQDPVVIAALKIATDSLERAVDSYCDSDQGVWSVMDALAAADKAIASVRTLINAS